MKSLHIDPAIFIQGIDSHGELPLEEAVAHNLHVLEVCSECRTRILAHLQLATYEDFIALITQSRDPLHELRRREEALKGAQLVAWLESLPELEQLAAIPRDPAVQTQAAIQGLLTRVKEVRHSAPQKARALTGLAVTILPHLRETPDDLFEREEVAVLVWAHHGNVLRILSDLRGAERSFLKAHRMIAKRPIDPLVVAETCGLHASLLRAQRRFQEALDAAANSIRLYGEWDCMAEQGRQLLKRAKIHSDYGQSEEALADLRRAMPLLDIVREPRLEWVAASVHLHLLCELGRYDEAAAHLSHGRELAARYGGLADLLRINWCEAVVAKALGLPVAAEPALVDVRRGFIELGNAYDAALVSLDLAVLWAEQGRTEEIKTLAQEMLTIFESRGVKTEALAAAFLFCRAVWQEQATVAALKGIREQLKEAQRA